MKLHLIDNGDGKFILKKSFEDNLGICQWEIPENMNFTNYGGFPQRIDYLIDMQEVAITQCETAIRRLPLRKKILEKLKEVRNKIGKGSRA